MNKIGWILATSVALSGCATDPKTVQGNSPVYQVAFAEGCDSAAARNNPYYMYEKDIRAYRNDAAYNTGWKQGYVTCKDQTWPGNTELLFRQMKALPSSP